MLNTAQSWLFTLAFSVSFLAHTSHAAESTGTIMHEVFDGMAYLLPLSVRASNIQSEWDDELIELNLARLERASAALASHANGNESEFELLARSFEKLARDIATSFRKQWPSFAYYRLMELTDHCVSCHQRLPAESRSRFGQKLLARMPSQDLEPRARLSLLLATREFDHALNLLEQQLMLDTMDPVEAGYRGLMSVYLRVALSTGNKHTRVTDFLERYRARDDQPFFIKRRIDRWLEALLAHDDALNDKPNLDYARRTFSVATATGELPSDQSRIVDDLVAARLMRTWLAQNPTSSTATRAEIYYALAVIALRSSEPEPAVPEMEMLLVSCIKADPGGPYAERAYAMLEEYGFIDDEHLARQLESQVLIDMAELRRLAGLDDNRIRDQTH